MTVQSRPNHGPPPGGGPWSTAGRWAQDDTRRIRSGAAAPILPTADTVHRDPRFRRLRSRSRRFAFTTTAVFLAWYGLFVGLSAFAPSLMRTPVLGSVNVGILLGLSQFATTLAIVGLYGRFARRHIDPAVEDLRGSYGTRLAPVRDGGDS